MHGRKTFRERAGVVGAAFGAALFPGGSAAIILGLVNHYMKPLEEYSGLYPTILVAIVGGCLIAPLAFAFIEAILSAPSYIRIKRPDEDEEQNQRRFQNEHRNLHKCNSIAWIVFLSSAIVAGLGAGALTAVKCTSPDQKISSAFYAAATVVTVLGPVMAGTCFYQLHKARSALGQSQELSVEMRSAISLPKHP